jgi:hypothetical protein
MMTIYIIQSGSAYTVETIHCMDEEALIMYLRARGVTYENSMKALKALVHQGKCTMQQE